MFLKQNLFNLCDIFEYIFNNKIFFFQIMDVLCSNKDIIIDVLCF